MNKKSLASGIVFTIVGLIFLLSAIFCKTVFEGLLWGFAGALLAIGVGQIIMYIYWSSPKNIDKYNVLLDNKDIESNDELNIQIKNRAGRLAYQFSYIVIAISIFVFAFLGKAGLLTNYMIFVYYLIGLLLLTLAAYIIAFNHFRKELG